MKFQVVFKTPDAVEEAVRDEAEYMMMSEDFVSEETEEAMRDYIENAQEFASQWVQYGEVVTIEFDTKARTARVVPVR
jgi:hypothetical protein